MHADPAPSEILVVDLLGGIGDLVMALPVIHGLGERFPTARLRVVTHEPGAQLLRSDPAVTEIRTPRDETPGAERTAVADAVARHTPDLAITTTRYDGIPSLLADAAARSVTDLWRHPPPDELVGERYLRILHAEGVLPATDLHRRPAIRLTGAERRRGSRAIAALLRPARSTRRRRLWPGQRRPFAYRPPVVLITDAGMAVKRWPATRWQQLADGLRRAGHPVLAVPPRGGARYRARARGPEVRQPRRTSVLPAGRQANVSLPRRRSPGTRLPARPVMLPRECRLPVARRRYLVGGLRHLAACFAAVGRLGGIVVGPDTGPMRVAAAAGAATVALFGPTDARRYGLSPLDIQGLPGCPHRRPTAITEQPCWWTAGCPLQTGNGAGPACMADISVPTVVAAIRAAMRRRAPGSATLSAPGRADHREG